MPRGPGRPELYPIKKVIGFDQLMIDAIDRWREQQEPTPNTSDAIRSLVEIGLTKTRPAALARVPKRSPGTKTAPAKKTPQRRS